MVERVRAASFPELGRLDIRVKTLKSDSDFFHARFAFHQFFFFERMSYLITVNPAVFKLQAPPDGLDAITAHELSHVLYYSSRRRLRLLGLVRLASENSNARFERGADLEAISRGYGEGLKEYREWLYYNVPTKALQEKKRNYFTPPEIDALLFRIHNQPALLGSWLKKPPLNLQEIEARKAP